MKEVAMGPGGEFDLVRRMLAVWGDAASGIGSDCAELLVPSGSRLIVSTDSAVDNIHFRREWLTPRQISYRAATAALSDLAAAAAEPLGILVALNLPERWLDDVEELAAGIGEAARKVSARIIGGDIARAAEFCITFTVLGHTARPLSRVGARVHDLLVVTGDVGRSAAALAALQSGTAPADPEMQRFARPEARIREAAWMAAQGATAAIDISDGLGSELAHLASAGNVRLRVHLEKIPSHGDALAAMRSGEEYELLAAVPPAFPVRHLERDTGTPLTVIGEVIPGESGVELFSRGQLIALPLGHTHF